MSEKNALIAKKLSLLAESLEAYPDSDKPDPDPESSFSIDIEDYHLIVALIRECELQLTGS